MTPSFQEEATFRMSCHFSNGSERTSTAKKDVRTAEYAVEMSRPTTTLIRRTARGRRCFGSSGAPSQLLLEEESNKSQFKLVQIGNNIFEYLVDKKPPIRKASW